MVVEMKYFDADLGPWSCEGSFVFSIRVAENTKLRYVVGPTDSGICRH